MASMHIILLLLLLLEFASCIHVVNKRTGKGAVAVSIEGGNIDNEWIVLDSPRRRWRRTENELLRVKYDDDDSLQIGVVVPPSAIVEIHDGALKVHTLAGEPVAYPFNLILDRTDPAISNSNIIRITNSNSCSGVGFGISSPDGEDEWLDIMPGSTITLHRDGWHLLLFFDLDTGKSHTLLIQPGVLVIWGGFADSKQIITDTIIRMDRTIGGNRCFGTVNHPNGDRYEGEFHVKDGKYVMKKGRYESADRDQSREIISRANGEAVLTYRKVLYSGAIRDGLAHGYGKWSYLSGVVFEGEFLEGRVNGAATVSFLSGAVFKGEFVDGKAAREGVWKYGNGEEHQRAFYHRAKAATFDVFEEIDMATLPAGDQMVDEDEMEFPLHNLILSRYEIVQHIGSGTYGQVFMVIDQHDGLFKAIKINHDSDSLEEAYNELDTLNHLGPHPGIINLLTSYDCHHHLYLVFSLLHINLADYIDAKSPIHRSVLHYMATQLLNTLQFLKSREIIHGDLKPQNIALKSRLSSKICVLDFGASASVDVARCSKTDPCLLQTLWYRAPEVIFDMVKDLDYAADMWSLGCILGELHLRRPLFRGNDEKEQLALMMTVLSVPDVAHKKLTLAKSKCVRIAFRVTEFEHDKDLLDLIMKCLKWDPQERITPEEALRHPYFNTLSK